MSRYIDADKALEDFDNWIDSTGALGKGTSYYCEARACIEDVPTADVVEVKHGEWIPIEVDVIFKCSICEAEVSTSWEYEEDDMFNYCPCCGAKMKGGEA